MARDQSKTQLDSLKSHLQSTGKCYLNQGGYMNTFCQPVLSPNEWYIVHCETTHRIPQLKERDLLEVEQDTV